jgi:hypothetical protein
MKITSAFLISASILIILSGFMLWTILAPSKIIVNNPHSFETAAGMRVGAALLTFENKGGADQLMAASSPISERVELHTMINDKGIMRMREVEDIVLAWGETIFKPDGYHLMLMDLKAPLRAGEKFPMTLEFKDHDPITIEVVVRSRQELKNILEGRTTP